MKFHKIKLFRAVLLPLLARLNPGDITIRHHYTGDPVRLHSYRHKGYWFHGRRREKRTMEMFTRLVKPGDTVIEVGGHIGYISLFLKHLIKDGQIFVFEPGANNLPYIRRNLAGRGVELIEKAAGATAGVNSFFMDSLSGQNNSMLRDFHRREETSAGSFDKATAVVQEIKVETISLDQFVAERNLKPDFLKIDVEGFEYEVVSGMHEILAQHRPAIMVEIQTHFAEISKIFGEAGYVLLDASGQKLVPRPSMNVFCLHQEQHHAILKSLGAL